MVKRAKLTLEPDPVETTPDQETGGSPKAQPAPKKAPTKTAKAPAKDSKFLKTVFIVGLTVASIVIFKRKIF